MKLYGSQAGWYYFINNHLGTPQKIINSAGTVVWAGFYLPFGKAWAYPATITNNFRFPGQYYDAETGLHYNWHRYYDPDTGRYITSDPIGLEGGINLYAYIRNPINSIDTKGLSPSFDKNNDGKTDSDYTNFLYADLKELKTELLKETFLYSEELLMIFRRQGTVIYLYKVTVG